MMQEKEVIRFDGDEEGYLQWMVDHPDAYVLNARRDEVVSTGMLHRSGCAHIRVIRNQEVDGAFTKRGGIKLCSYDVRSLLALFAQGRSAELMRIVSCRSCRPLPVDIELQQALERSPSDPSWEKDALLRALCLRYHGTRCQVCQMDLAQRYGPLGASSTEVHLIHAEQFSDSTRIPDPVADMVPVCPSCHVMLHIGRSSSLPIEDLRKRLARARIRWNEQQVYG